MSAPYPPFFLMGLGLTLQLGSVQPPTFSTQCDLKITFHSHKKILFSQNVFADISVSVVYLLDHIFSYSCAQCMSWPTIAQNTEHTSPLKILRSMEVTSLTVVMRALKRTTLDMKLHALDVLQHLEIEMLHLIQWLFLQACSPKGKGAAYTFNCIQFW